MDNEIVLAVAHGSRKTIIYLVDEVTISKIKEMLAPATTVGEPSIEDYEDKFEDSRWNRVITALKLVPHCATNAEDEEVAEEAEEYETEADYFIDLDNLEESLSEWE